MEETILIADSCAGGLSILKDFLEWSGNYNVIYLADGEKNPFGKKSEEEIKEIVISWIKNFKSKNLKMLVIACNTASIAVKSIIKEISIEYNLPVVTMVESFERTCQRYKNKIKDKKIIIFGTTFTINSEAYRKITKKYFPKEIFYLDGTNSERLVARGLFNEDAQKKLLNKEISQYKSKSIDSVFLCCTCFEFIKEDLKKNYGKNINLINPSKEMSVLAKQILNIQNPLRKEIEKVDILTTGEIKEWTENINQVATRIFSKNLNVKKIKLLNR